MRPHTIQIGKQSKTGFVQRIGNTLWIHLDGETFTYEPQLRQSKRKKSELAPSASDVVAPMPGKIIKVAISEGSEVTKGQLLIVLEAMKMEYSLKASLAGRAKTVKCKVGDQVVLGQLLVAVDPKQSQ